MKTLIALVLCWPLVAFSQVISPEEVFPWIDHRRNYVEMPTPLKNGTLANWVVTSNATITRDTDSADALDGVASYICDASAQNGYCEWDSKTIAEGDKSGSCSAAITYKGDATLYKVQVYDGTSAISVSETLENATDWQLQVFNYPCGSSRKVRLTQTESGTGAAVNVGRIYWGPAINIGTVAQARHLGSVSYAGTSGCSWSGASATFSNYNPDTDCPTPTVTGSVSAPATKLPAVVVSGAPGTYKFTAIGSFQNGSGAECRWRFSDGTLSSASIGFYDASVGGVGHIVGFVTTTSPLNASQFQLQTAGINGVATTCSIVNAYSNEQFSIDVEYIPSQPQTVVRADQTNYGWTSYTPTFNAHSSVTDINCEHRGDGETMFWRCNWNAGSASASEARVSFPGTLVSASSYPTLANVGFCARGFNTGETTAVLVEPSVGYFTFGVAGSGSSSLAKTTGSGVGTGSISCFGAVKIAGWRENGKAPQLVNSVVSPLDGVTRVIAARITNNGTTCAVASELGDGFGSCTRNGNGDVTVAFTTAFSSAPFCTCNTENTTYTVCTFEPGEITTTSVGFATVNPNVARGDATAQIMCIGPK